MTDREKVITTLTKHLDHWKRLFSEGVCCEVEGKETIDALTFAIESIKVDRAYDLMYEKVDFIEIPDNATNGDVVKAVFPQFEVFVMGDNQQVTLLCGEMRMDFSKDWWNSPYRKE